jgi:Tfp pilus assembly protein PilF
MDRSELLRQVDLALAALQHGQDVRAVAITDQLVAEAAEDPLVCAVRAQALLSGSSAEEAFAAARRAAELNPASEHAQRVLGLAAWRDGRLSLAEQSLQRAVELSGRRGNLLAEYAWFMASERGPRAAEAAAREAIEADRRSSTAWTALGVAQHHLHRRDEAEASLRRALELDADDLNAQSAMVDLLQERRQDDRAGALTEVMENHPEAEEYVASVREETRARRLAGLLIERQAMPEPSAHDRTRYLAVLLPVAAVIFAALCFPVLPEGAAALAVACLIPLLLLWYLRRLFD